MSYLRSSIDFDSCGMLLLLRSNHRFWDDPKLFDEIMLDEKPAAATDVVEDIEANGVDGFDDDN